MLFNSSDTPGGALGGALRSFAYLRISQTSIVPRLKTGVSYGWVKYLRQSRRSENASREPPKTV